MSTTNRDYLFDKRNYSSWRERMKGYKNYSKNLAKKEAKKNHSTIIKGMLDSLSDQNKQKKKGQCTFAKQLWLRLENHIHVEVNNMQYSHSIEVEFENEINEGMYSPRH